MSKLRILVTTVGGLTSPDILKALKNNGERAVELFGVDPFEFAVGRSFVDHFKVLPYSGSSEKLFVEELFDLAKKLKVDLIVPCGNEDNLAISRFSSDSPCPVMVADRDVLVTAYDKGKVYGVLSESLGPHAPRHFIVNDYEGFRNAKRELGFPDQKLVVKPRFGRGGRGVFTLSADLGLKELFGNKPSSEYSIEFFESLFACQKFPVEILVMEHLSEPFHSVYSLCYEGTQYIAVDHLREWGSASQTYRGKIHVDPLAEEIAGQVVSLFNLSFAVNMEFGISDDGRFVLFDLNPRIAASCAVDRDIGINFPFLAAKLALGEGVKIDSEHLRLPRRFIRYFDYWWSDNALY